MLTQWIRNARAGHPVWLPDVRERCTAMKDAVPVTMQLTAYDGTRRDFPLPLPRWQGAEQRRFVRDYAAACVYNTLSACSGQAVTLYLDRQEREAAALLWELAEVFQLRQSMRTGYGKVIQIAERLCGAFGAAHFSFTVRDRSAYVPAPPESTVSCDLTPLLRRAVSRCGRGVCCGIDIGGTDIKAVLAKDGRLLCVKEFDWDPAASPTAEGIIDPILLLVRLLSCCAAGITPALRAALDREAAPAQMEQAAADSPCLPLDVLGISFPDVVIRDRIVGGETPKTRGMRLNPDVEYGAAFARLGRLPELLRPLCREGADLHLTNDGHIAAFTAAAELACGSDTPDFTGGIIAHALGTDFGMGFLAPDGSIPEMPMELYDFLLDLGSFPQRSLPPEDLRSTCNENSGLPGARRYLGQAAAFRLAYDADPGLLAGFTEASAGMLIVQSRLRKDCLSHLMEQAASGSDAAQSVFRGIGSHIGQISREMAPLLLPRTDVRYLFGRFVKQPVCFRLMQEGCHQVLPSLRLEAADEELALSPLMRQLAAAGATVAQFGQAIGAIYYAAM